MLITFEFSFRLHCADVTEFSHDFVKVSNEHCASSFLHFSIFNHILPQMVFFGKNINVIIDLICCFATSFDIKYWIIEAFHQISNLEFLCFHFYKNFYRLLIRIRKIPQRLIPKIFRFNYGHDLVTTNNFSEMFANNFR